jgi:hypothetical protein
METTNEKHPLEVELEMVHFQASNLKDGHKQVAIVFVDNEGKEYEYTQNMRTQDALNMTENYAKCSKVVGYKNPRANITHFYWPKPFKATEKAEVETEINPDIEKLKGMESASASVQ